MAGTKFTNLFLKRGIYYVKTMIGGVRYRVSTGYGLGAEKSALRKRDEILVKLRNEEDFGKKSAAPLFSAWVKDYKAVYTVQKEAPWRDEQILAPALEFFGRKRLDEITRSTCVRYLNERGKDVAPSTLNRERGTLQAVFERALEDGLIEKNPFHGIAKEKEGPRIRILSLEDEKKLRAVMTPLYQRWLTFMLGTGLRLEEARGVSIEKVGFETKLIDVSAETAKGGKARQVPLRPEVAEVITLQQAELGHLWPANAQRYRDVLQAKCKAAKIGHISPHDLRHTFATRWLQGKGDIYHLSKILGHSSVKMTEKYYVHLSSVDLVKASEGVDLRMAS